MQAYENRALELVATALSDEYGVRVHVGGMRAITNRDANGFPVINIPAVPTYDPDYRLLIRGYIDHEVGHVRFSDQKAIEAGILADREFAGAVKAVSSIYEDILVDRLMGEVFIGCRRNLRKLVCLVYLDKTPPPPDAEELLARYNNGIMNPREMPWHVWNAVLRYLVYAGRAAALPKLEPMEKAWRIFLARIAPGLTEILDQVLRRLPEEGRTSGDNVRLARETVGLLENYFTSRWEIGTSGLQAESALEFPWLLRNGGEARDTSDLGMHVSRMIDSLLQEMEDLPQDAPSIHHPVGSEIWEQRVTMLSEEDRKEALQSSAKMAAKMHALLQSHVLNREGPFRRGKLQTRGLHKLFIGRDDIFCRNAERRELDTELALCVDMSGSMRFDNKAKMASKALYAIADSLARIQGLRFHMLGFFDNHVVELRRPNSPLTGRLAIVPDGGTLCGAATREAAQCFTRSHKKRKIIMMITDGDANDHDSFIKALEELRSGGVQFLGIGIMDDHILEYIPKEDCRIIEDLGELAESVLAMLRRKMGIRV